MRTGAPQRTWTSPPPAAGGPPRRPSPTLAATASVLLPGAGQLLVGRRRSGALLVGASLLLAGAAVATVVTRLRGGSLVLLAWLVQPRVLAGLVLANIAVAAVRAGAALDAWRVARSLRKRIGAAQVAGVTVVLTVLVGLPHAGVALAGARAQEVVDAVFVASAAAPAPPREPPPTALPPPPTALQPQRTAVQPPRHEGPAGGRDDATPPSAPSFLRDEPLGGAGRLTVLLLGSDAGPERAGARIDALVVASVDLRTGRTALVSVARNLGDVPLTGVFAERLGGRFPDPLMALHAAAAGDPVLAATFDDPGSAAHVNSAEALLGLRVDHVAKVDLAGFVDLVDALGGVEVDVGAPVRVRLSPPRPGEDWRAYDIPAGRQRLDGHEAHAYVRSRAGGDDYDRMRRQRCLLGSAVAEADTARLLRRLPRLTDVLVERVRTDVPRDRLPDLVRVAARVDLSALRTLGVSPPAYSKGLDARGFHRADVDEIQAAVRELLSGAGPAPPGTADLAATCG